MVAGGKFATLLLILPASASADPGRPEPAAAWKAPLDYVIQILKDEPSRVVRDHVVSLAAGIVSLIFEYTDGGALTLSLERGEVLIDGRAVGHFPEGGALEVAWRQLALDAARSDAPGALSLLRSWQPEGLSREEASYAALLRGRVATLSAPPGAMVSPQSLEAAPPGGLSVDLTDLSDPERLAPLLRSAVTLRGPALRITVPGGRAYAGAFSVGSGERRSGHHLIVRGDANIYGTLDGNLATVDGDVVIHPGGVVTGDVLAVAGQVRDLGGEIGGEIRTLDPPRERVRVPEASPPVSGWMRLARNAAGVTGVFLTLLCVGFGLVLFARPPLEVVSDTVLHSFSRSFLVGLLGQVLVLPTFGMLVVGLVLSVAGILLVPFAVIVFALLLIVAILGGFLAIAHAMGESLTRRQLAQGASIANANSYRYVTVGLAAVALLWLAWVLFGWVPVAGTLVLATAVLVTWLLGTVGFGASLLSRAGLREHFAGRLLPHCALSAGFASSAGFAPSGSFAGAVAAAPSGDAGAGWGSVAGGGAAGPASGRFAGAS